MGSPTRFKPKKCIYLGQTYTNVLKYFSYNSDKNYGG